MNLSLRLSQEPLTTVGKYSMRVMHGMPGPVFVLVHGLGSSGVGTFDVLAGLLTELGDVVAVDLHGHGENGLRSPRPFTVAACAEDLRRLLRLRGESNVVVIGHSLGGHVAVALAAADLKLPQEVPLVGTLIVGGTAATLPEPRLAKVVGFLDALPTWIRERVEPIFYRGIGWALEQERKRQAQRQGPGYGYLSEFRLGHRPTIGSAALETQRSKVEPAARAIAAGGLPCGVVVHTSDSRVDHHSQANLAELLKAAVISPDGGHNLPWMEPELYFEGIKELLGRLRSNDA